MIIDNQAQYFIREADVRTREKIKEIGRGYMVQVRRHIA
jgi:hypothetical protein